MTATGRARVMTWNVWWRFGAHWRQRQRGILTTIEEAAPDVVALQEAWGTAETTQAHELAEALGMHAAFAAPSLPPPPATPEHPDQRDVAVGLGLLSRWPITRVRALPMPSRRVPAPVAMVAELQHPSGLLPVVVACLEWESAYHEDRIAQGHMLADVDADIDRPQPVIVAGDLNASPSGPVLVPLQAVTIDAWVAGGGDPSAVTLSSDHPDAPVEVPELIDQRIDHVLVRPAWPGQHVAVTRAALAGDEPIDGLYPSDHRAVVCDLEWSPSSTDGSWSSLAC